MSNQIIKAANEYAEMAETISISAEEAAFDVAADGYIDDALLRLYYLKALENKLGGLQAQLDEQTDADTFEATMTAEEAINKATDVVFGAVEAYAGDNDKFRKRVEKTTVNTASEDRFNLLCQLYRCEGILRMAYVASRHVPVYGAGHRMLEHLDGIEDYKPEAPEDTVYQDTGIDLYALHEVRKKLLEAIGNTMKNDAL